MKHFAFISRHTPTEDQVRLAADQGIALHQVGDYDAFSVTPDCISELSLVLEHLKDGVEFDGVIVVHPAAALRLVGAFEIGVFENANRAPEGERPTFEAIRLHLFGARP